MVFVLTFNEAHESVNNYEIGNNCEVKCSEAHKICIKMCLRTDTDFGSKDHRSDTEQNNMDRELTSINNAGLATPKLSQNDENPVLFSIIQAPIFCEKGGAIDKRGRCRILYR